MSCNQSGSLLPFRTFQNFIINPHIIVLWLLCLLAARTYPIYLVPTINGWLDVVAKGQAINHVRPADEDGNTEY